MEKSSGVAKKVTEQEEALEMKNEALSQEVERLNAELSKKQPVEEGQTELTYEGKKYALVVKAVFHEGKLLTAKDIAADAALTAEFVEAGALVREL